MFLYDSLNVFVFEMVYNNFQNSTKDSIPRVRRSNKMTVSVELL